MYTTTALRSFRRPLTTVLATAIATLLVLQASALAGPALPGDQPDDLWVTNGAVNAIATTGDAIYIGGAFTQVGPRTGNASRLDAASGLGLDGDFAVVAGGIVFAAEPDGQGGWYLGGSFTSVNGEPRSGLAHVTEDGALSAGWAPNVTTTGGAPGIVRTIAVGEEQVYIGGTFLNVDGLPRNRIARISRATPVIVDDFNPNANNIVFTLELDEASDLLYVGGQFTTIGGSTRNRIAALDLTTPTGTASSWNPNSNNIVYAMVRDGSTLYVGGQFTNVGGSARNRIASLDTSVPAGTALAFNPNATNNLVLALALDGTTLYAGGTFTTVGGQPRNRIAALDTTVPTDNSLPFNPDASGAVNALQVVDGDIIAGGEFTVIGGVPRARLARLATSSGFATPFRLDANAPLHALATDGDTLLVGGAQTSLGSVDRNRIAAIDTSSGSVTDWDPNAQGTVEALAVSPDGSTVYVGGAFTTIGGMPRSRIAALDAGTDTGQALPWNPNAQSTVFTLALDPDVNAIYVGGQFTSIGGQLRNRIARMPLGSNVADGFNPNASGIVRTLALDTDEEALYVGGDFATIGGEPRAHLAELGTTTGTATAWNPAPSARVRGMNLEQDVLRVAGEFLTIGGLDRNRYAAINRVGAGTATSWNPNANNIGYDVLTAFGATYAAGQFTTIGNAARNRLAALDPSQPSNQDLGWNPDANNIVLKLGRTDDALLAGGQFTTVAGGPQQGLARFTLTPRNTVTPMVVGATLVGATLTCDPGQWTGGALEFTTSWSASGAEVGTGPTLVLGDAQAGTDITCTVTASNAAGSATATSSELAIPAPAEPPAVPDAPPTLAAPPRLLRTDGRLTRSLRGRAQLSCMPGTWLGADTVSSRWWARRLRADGSLAPARPGPAQPDLAVGSGLVGNLLTCRVTAQAGTATATASTPGVWILPQAPVTIHHRTLGQGGWQRAQRNQRLARAGGVRVTLGTIVRLDTGGVAADVPVTLQERGPRGAQWRRVGTVRTNAQGRAATTVRVQHGTSMRWVVAGSTVPPMRAGSSPTVTFTR